MKIVFATLIVWLVFTCLPSKSTAQTNFSAVPTSGFVPLNVQFKDTFFVLPTQWVWHFGDSGFAFVQNPIHTYATPGIYTVILQVVDTFGIQDTIAFNCIAAYSPPGIISTIAGNGVAGYSGNGVPVDTNTTEFNHPTDIKTDCNGNLIISDGVNSLARAIKGTSPKIITTKGGNGSSGNSGNGGPATAAMLNNPSGVAADCKGNIYISDTKNNTIRKIDSSGIITAIAGNGTAGYFGDSAAAVSAQLNNPTGIITDASVNIYFADTYNNRIRKIDNTGIITTVAGNGFAGYAGDFGPATVASLNHPSAITFDNNGNLYIADSWNSVIRKVDIFGTITTVAGTGASGYTCDFCNALTARLDTPSGLAADGAGFLYIADTHNNLIRKLDLNQGIIFTIAGDSSAGYTGDGGISLNALLNHPAGIAFSNNSLYIADEGNNVIRQIQSLPPYIWAGPVTGQIAACKGTASASPLLQQFTVSGNYLASGILVTAPGDFEVSTDSAGKYYQSMLIEPSGNYISDTFVYVRSASSAKAGNISGNVVLSSVGATTQNVAVTGIVTARTTPVINITASPGDSVCSGTNVTFAAISVNGGQPPAYQWLLNHNKVGKSIKTYSDSTLQNGDVISCLLTSDAVCATPDTALSNIIVMKVISDVTPSVSITGPDTAICSGISATFTATPANGGASPNYQWKVNSKDSGTDSPTYTSSALANGDVITCLLTSNAVCVVPDTALSNSVVVNIISKVTPLLSISGPVGAVCPGMPVTFTATATNGGPSPNYQWRVNNADSGTNSPTYTSSALVNGDVIICLLTDNEACAMPDTALSNSITVSFATKVTPSVTITGPDSAICSGLPATFTATPTNGGASANYQWRVNNADSGTNSLTYSSSALANGDVISCLLTSDTVCASPDTALSNFIVMKVLSNVTPSISINGPDTAICSGSPAKFNATPSNGGPSPNYQWKVSGQNSGTNSTAYTSSALAAGDVISCLLISDAICASPDTALSNIIVIKIITDVMPSLSITGPDTAICSGTAATFTATPANGGGSPNYQWKVNGQDSGTNSPIYTSASLANGDVVSCVLISRLACVTSDTSVSNTDTVKVISATKPAVSIVASPTDKICAGTPVTFTATTIGYAVPSYLWLHNGSPEVATGSSYSTSNLQNQDSVNCVASVNATCAVADTSQAIYITVYARPTVIFKPDTVYTTSNNGVMLSPSISGAAGSYQWLPSYGLSPSNTVADPVANPGTTTVYQLRIATDKGCADSASITVIEGLPMEMPGAFTPNGDGHNDVFRVPPGVQLTLQEFDIFDRWGRKIFFSKDITGGWDGTFNGMPAPLGTYIYVIKGTTATGQPVTLKGSVVLIR